MHLVFTDLDGTLLDHETYSWEPARAAVQRLRQQRVPWIFVTSKTRAEVEFWRGAMDNRHPFIVENGAAAFVPLGNGYQVLEWGTPYEELVAGLCRASEASGCRVRGFHEMSAKEVAAQCLLPIEQAVLAKEREYDEPFLILDEERADLLLDAIRQQGWRCTRGDRFWHIMGANDKALAVSAIHERFEKALGPVTTIGLGDGFNDVAFLNAMRVPVVIHSRDSAAMMDLVPRALLTARPGPAGWSDAILSALPG